MFALLQNTGLNASLSRFHVFYSRSTETHRKFDNQLLSSSHNYSIDPFPLYFYFRGFHFHFNPILLLRIILSLRRSSIIILGTSWWSLNNLILFLLLFPFRQFLDLRIGLWVEDNKYSSSSIISSFKKYIYSLPDFFVVQVLDQKIVSNFLKSSSQQSVFSFLTLLTQSFCIPYSPLASSPVPSNIPETKIHILIAARFVEKKKGIINFINSLNSFPQRSQFKLSLVGDGPDRKDVLSTIQSVDFEVVVLGNVGYEQISYLYRMADVFCLPSYEDPSPLSLVEAAYSSLPIICSVFCGNCHDVVLPHHNGFIFDPHDRLSMTQSFTFLLANRERLHEMGANSLKYIDKTYNPDTVASAFYTHLLSLSTKKIV